MLAMLSVLNKLVLMAKLAKISNLEANHDSVTDSMVTELVHEILMHVKS